ncbi:hypothetical protein [Burkholderia cenocepacia]|uniref:hypothetical protein n=1 Tax=Burkholderia cenocepacia TaxID=95486 RepID=UPI00076DDC6C|nr:hypothetical protein [Burkholderia cenocepacia]KWU19045.1 hypothetical protein AS149_12420 [Burkholderia cenocepacia]
MQNADGNDVVTVRGSIEGASYSGCEGWHSWYIGPVEVTGPRQSIQRLKRAKEAEVRAQGSQFSRRDIEWH